MSQETICPFCGKTEHVGQAKEIEEFIMNYHGNITIKMIAEKFNFSHVTASKYLKNLYSLGLLYRHYEGSQIYYHRIVKA